MKLPFRQGIVKYTEDNNKFPIYLDADKRDNYVNLQVEKYSERVLLNFAYLDSNYLFEEIKSVYQAWGPFSADVKYWLYWDLNKLNGDRTFGSTIHEPIISYDEPLHPQIDQHWFDLSSTCMKVFDGNSWVKNIRLFACTYQNGTIIAYPLLSQVSIFTECEAGFIIFDDLNSPSQKATVDGSYKFLTSDSNFANSKSVTTTVSLNQIITHGISATFLPKYSLVSYNSNGQLQLASYDDEYKSIAVGITTQDVNEGESFYYKQTTYINYDTMYWVETPSTPLYLGLNGRFSSHPPPFGFIQKVGTILSTTEAYIDTSYHNIHYNHNQKNPVPLSVNLKTGKFNTKQPQPDCSSYVFYNVQTINYEFTTANYIWLLTHDPRSANYVVQSFNNIGEMITPLSITPISNSTIRLTFDSPVTGTATLFLY